MAIAYLTRAIHFTASHHYGRPEWSKEENIRVFGAHRDPHGHDYTLEVTLRGEVDPESGFLTDLGALDALLGEIRDDLDGQDLNAVLESAEDGDMMPSTENLTVWLWGRLAGRIPGATELYSVRLLEGPTLWSEFRGER